MLFGLDAHDRALVPTPATTRKIKNIEAHPLVRLIIAIGNGRSSCTGPAPVVAGDEAAANHTLVWEDNLGAGPHETARFLRAHEDRSIVITPTKFLSWSTDAMAAWFETNPAGS